MRQAVTIGKLADGSFVPLALPDRDVMEHRALVREVITDGGRIGKGKDRKQLVEILHYNTIEKRKRFDARAPAAEPRPEKK